MNQIKFRIKSNLPLTDSVYRMELLGETSEITSPGQFVQVKVPEKFLRRPISVCDYDEGSLTLIYKVVGEGTDLMSKMMPDDVVDILTGLGNGYDTSRSGKTPVLIGGGVGVPPLYALAKKLVSEGKTPSVVLGFNTKSEIFLADEFRVLKIPVYITTADGSEGIKGFVTDALQSISYSYFYTCGPLPMFKAVSKVMRTEGQYSLEERMGCGFGACMGCTIDTPFGPKRVCKEGPVFKSTEVTI